MEDSIIIYITAGHRSVQTKNKRMLGVKKTKNNFFSVFLEPEGDRLRQCISGTKKDHIK